MAKAVDDEGLSGSNAGKAVFMNLDQTIRPTLLCEALRAQRERSTAATYLYRLRQRSACIVLISPISEGEVTFGRKRSGTSSKIQLFSYALHGLAALKTAWGNTPVLGLFGFTPPLESESWEIRGEVCRARAQSFPRSLRYSPKDVPAVSGKSHKNLSADI
ncbi:hypothetical protein Y1Q_0009330 [Alligator mississippiensis]|uniref:Uncharacterized protein n=1 Tax=Alligator mississippiensis TaxID=8496 RepID=A0A151N7Z8_ALLMI|nr:hypothetical protein Y1Q_0009330 [Alligator mississippiensis]